MESLNSWPSLVCHVLLGAKPEKEPEAHHCELEAKVQQIQVSNWLKVRCKHLLDAPSDLETECLFQELDTYDYQDTCC